MQAMQPTQHRPPQGQHHAGQRWPATLLHLLAWCLATALALLPANAATPPLRVALLIGNDAYPGPADNPGNQWRRLRAAAKDARDIGARLKALGFDSVEVFENLSRHRMVEEIARFKLRAESADQVFFYFNGHGTQDDGINYLLPVDMPPRDPERIGVKAQGLRLDNDVLLPLRRGKGLKVVAIDACRTPGDGKGEAGGLANPEREQRLPPQTVVLFAAEAGQPAMDGASSQSNGYFAQGMLKGLSLPDTSLINVMDTAEEVVQRLSGRLQQPVMYGGAQAQLRFAFAPPQPVAPPVLATPPAAPDPRISQLEQRIRELERGPVVRPETPAPAPTLQPGQFFEAYAGGPKLVLLPGGSYRRGTEDEEGRFEQEGPVKVVTIKPGLAMGQTEVTKGQFGQFVAETGHPTDAERDGGCFGWTGSGWKKEARFNWRQPGFDQTDAHPVVCVSWNDAGKYIEWLNKKAGIAPTATGRYRLPSEAEWEYAARDVTSADQKLSGAQHWRFFWGDDPGYRETCKYGNVADASAKKRFNWSPTADCDDGYVYTAPVGKFDPSPNFKLYDMVGNAWEWTQDCKAGYADVHTDGRAWEPADKVGSCARVLRGG